MIVVRPIAITEAILTANDIPNNSETEWTSPAAFDFGDEVKVTTTDVNEVFVSVVAGIGTNQGNQPEDDDPVSPEFWARKSATNRWAMFSDQLSDQTTQTTSFEVELTPGTLVNAISFFNLEATMVQVVMNDPVDGEVYNRTVNLVDGAGVNNWYEWYFESITLQDTLSLLDLPPFIDAVITVTVTNTGGTAKLGLLTIGAQKELGLTDYSTGVGILDFSRKETDTFGNPIIVPRNFSKRGSYIVTVDTSFVNVVQNILADLRTTPATYIGEVGFPSTIIYGYYRDFNTVLSNPSKSLLTIEIEGLSQ